MASRYGVAAYRPEPDYYGGSRGGGSIADIILRGGDAQAQAHLARGQMWADTIRGVGDTIGGAIQQRAEQKEIAKRDQAWLSFVESGEWQDPQKAALGTLRIWGPGEEGQAQLRALGGIMQLGQQKRDPEADQKALTAIGAGMARMTDGGRAMAWPQAHALLQRSMPELAAQLPAEYDPKVWQELAPLLSGPEGQPPAPVKVGQGDSLVDPATGKVIFAGQPKPEAPMRLGEGDVLIDPTTGKRIAAGPPKAAQSSYQSKEVMGPDGRLMLANFDARTGRYVDPATGKAIENPRPAPSDSSRQDANKYANARPAIAAVAELSERINTLQGVMAKAAGAAERAAAKLNYDDDVAEYESIVQGFTPLIARAVGHTGVLTQADVESVRMLFPAPGDSKSLRDRKIARLESIFAQLQNGGAAAPMGGGSPAGGGPVKVRTPEEARKLPSGTLFQTPDGRTMRVP